jgi:transcriptional regulator with XRE-family HTH domain
MSYRLQKYHRPIGKIGRAVRSIRRRLNLSQGELAARLNCNRSAISIYETGRSAIGLGRTIALLGISGRSTEAATLLKDLERRGISASDLAFFSAATVSMLAVSDCQVAKATGELVVNRGVPEGATS